jgi:cytosine/adenosine deaminase-related metal-dependent hydrolase
MPQAEFDSGSLNMLARSKDSRQLHKPHTIALPGLINSHTHVSEILLRGSPFPDRDLYDWQWNVNYPAIRAFNERDTYVAALLFSIDALRSGTTTFVDNAKTGFSIPLIEAAISAYAVAGVRNVLAPIFATRPLADEKKLHLARSVQGTKCKLRPDEMFQSIDEVFGNLESLMQTHHRSRNGKQSIWPAPHKPTRTSIEEILRSYDLAERWSVMVSQPCSEVQHESQIVGSGAFEFLHRYGCLNRRTLLGHGVHVTNKELRLLCESTASVVHLPSANLYLGSGVAPVPSFLLAGIPVALGTDNANCNDSVNMFREMTLCTLLHKGVQQDAGAVTAQQVMAMATCGAAAAIGAKDTLGMIKPGMRADIVLVDTARTHLTPLHDPVGTLIFQANGSEVSTVIIDGEIVMDQGRLSFLDLEGEEELRIEAQRRSKEILNRAVY